MNHSLSAAVKAGIISEYSAYCGLSPDDLKVLSNRAPFAKVLIRFRGADSDGRYETTAKKAYAFAELHGELDTEFYAFQIRDITAVRNS